VSNAASLGPAVAGSWYPRDPDELAALVDRLLEAGGQAPRCLSPTSLIVPHAGFAYSGAVAASAFARLAGRSFDRIVLLGPSHYFAFRGAMIPDAATAYRTPLGPMEIDRDAVAALREVGAFRADDRVFDREHALEAELPFLQRALAGTAAVVPILMGGGAQPEDAQCVADALAPLLNASTLFVVSSDFTHFGPRFDYVPFTEDVPARIRKLDFSAIHAIEAGDAAAFARHVDATGATICGRRAIEVLLRLPRAKDKGTLLAYDTSGRMTGTWDHSVSYAAIELAAPLDAP